MTITGTGFTGATKVNFGTAAATNLDVVSAYGDHGHQPRGHGHGGRDGDHGPGGGSATSTADQFTYMTGLRAVSPATGPTGGGTR